MKKIEKKYLRIKARLFNKMQPFIKQYGIKDQTLLNAIEKSFREINCDERNLQPWLLSLVFLEIFDNKCFLLIQPRTKAGNAVSFEVLTAAYSIWREAQILAIIRGLDDLDAAEAMSRTVHSVTDHIARDTGNPIRDMQKYLFTSFIHALKRVAKKAGIARHPEWNPDISDEGAFIAALEKALLCKEIMRGMSRKVRKIADSRHMMGYSCKETAVLIGTSDCAARKTLSRGVRKVFGECLRKLRALGYVEMPVKKNKCRKSVGGGK